MDRVQSWGLRCGEPSGNVMDLLELDCLAGGTSVERIGVMRTDKVIVLNAESTF